MTVLLNFLLAMSILVGAGILISVGVYFLVSWMLSRIEQYEKNSKKP